jgi:hypothetical protein
MRIHCLYVLAPDDIWSQRRCKDGLAHQMAY